VAFLKFTRDKRGYENFYLMQPTGRGKSRPRLLYWFRTPPGVKVGRTPFDPEARRALEAQNPDVAFDWTAIVETPIPTADTERWRERRRVERVMRAAANEQGVEAGIDPDGGAEPERQGEPVAARPVAERLTEALPAASVLTVPAGELEPGPEAASSTAGDLATASNVSSPPPDPADTGHAHRRRRRRRGRRKPQVPRSGLQVPAGLEEARADGVAAGDPGPPEDDGNRDR
jgi:hypothetical protein